MAIEFEIPEKVQFILNKLIHNGHEAYIVGGCVRDSLLGKTPKDWDITTSAKPSDVKAIFRKTIDTGIQHGTVSVLIDKEVFEVTTYRIDGEYKDHRRPESIEFTTNLLEDLKRRDFTINAMAYNEITGLVDAFGGLDDIKEKRIKCVGSPRERFEEDALRMLRAIRFSAQLGYSLEELTGKAIKEQAESLKYISAERIKAELDKILISPSPQQLKLAYTLGITKVIMPEFDKMMETKQNNPYHIYTVGEHTLKALENIENDLVLRLTMLLHDIAKPYTKSTDQNGIDHFYGHQEEGADLAKEILKGLKSDNYTMDIVRRLIYHHGYPLTATKKSIRRAVNKIGTDIIELLFKVKKADIMAKNPLIIDDKLNDLEEVIKIYNEVKIDNECVTLKQLEVNGKDLMNIGIKPGIQIGQILDNLLNKVLDDPALNNKEKLLELSIEEYKNNPNKRVKEKTLSH